MDASRKTFSLGRCSIQMDPWKTRRQCGPKEEQGVDQKRMDKEDIKMSAMSDDEVFTQPNFYTEKF